MTGTFFFPQKAEREKKVPRVGTAEPAKGTRPARIRVTLAARVWPNAEIVCRGGGGASVFPLLLLRVPSPAKARLVVIRERAFNLGRL